MTTTTHAPLSDTRPTPGAAAHIGAFLEYCSTYTFRTKESLTLLTVIWLTAVTEPVLYLLSMGLGVGGLVDSDIAVDQHRLSYLQFVAPAMLAVSCMAGAIAASIFSFFSRHRYLGVFARVGSTSLSPREVVVADWLWEIIRVTMLSVIFVAVLVVTGLVAPGTAVLAVLAAVLVNGAFAALGIGISTLLRGWQDFDVVVVAQTVLFLFSGTFFPITQYPSWLQVIVELSPLYQAIELLRALIIGGYGIGILVHVGYLVLLIAGGLAFSVRRISKDFSK